MKGFRERMRETSERRESILILALDLKGERLLERSLSLLEEVSQSLCAVKLNRHLLLPLGLKGVKQIVEKARRLGIQTIMDCKLNDIGSTNLAIAESLFKAGFDALTVSPYVGWKEGLEPVFKLAKSLGRGVLSLVYMSHPGAKETFEEAFIQGKPAYQVFAGWAARWEADGLIVGATRPEKIREIHHLVEGKLPIYSPGVGFQGGSLEAAIENGANYIIVGRSILQTERPAEAAENFRRESWRLLRLRES